MLACSLAHIVLLTGMITRLWNYVSTFSNLSGERLRQIYSKLKQEQDEDGGVGGSSHVNNGSGWGGPVERPPRGYKSMSAYQTAESVSRSQDAGKFEAWKRRRRAVDATTTATTITTTTATSTTSTNSQQPLIPRPMSNGTRLPDPNSLGILGSGPADNNIRRFANEKPPSRMRQTGYPPRQGFSSVIK